LIVEARYVSVDVDVDIKVGEVSKWGQKKNRVKKEMKANEDVCTLSICRYRSSSRGETRRACHGGGRKLIGSRVQNIWRWGRLTLFTTTIELLCEFTRLA
jgi:hypothetical protein